MSDIIFKHVQFNEKVRVTLAAKQKGKSLDMGISICGEGEQFAKETGRRIASGRLTRGIVKTIPMATEAKHSHVLRDYASTMPKLSLTELKVQFGLNVHAITKK